MKKTLKIMISVLMCAVLCLAPCTFAFAEHGTAKTVTLRIEGIEKNLFNAAVTVEADGRMYVKDVVSAATIKDATLDIKGLETNYITAIKGDTAGSFGGYDGWLFSVNGKDASVGMDACEVNSGDIVVFYYGDPFGQGMQYPVADTSRINDGIITFSSTDTTYDESFNATQSVNPVKGAAVTFCGKSYITDENGSISLDKSTLKNGVFALTIERYTDAGLPTVLRFSPDYTVAVSGITESSNSGEPSETSSAVSEKAPSAVSETSSQTEKPASDVPKTADNSAVYMMCAVLLISLCALLTLTNFKKAYDCNNR